MDLHRDMKVNFAEHPEIWDKFVSISPHRNIFVQRRFIESLGVNYHLVTCYDGSRIVAGAVVILTATGRPIAAPHPFTMYQGILLSDNLHLKPHSKIPYELRIMDYFIGKLVDNYKLCCFCQPWRFTDIRPFQWYNYHQPQDGRFTIKLGYTGILDLEKYRSFDEYWHAVRSVRRQEFNKAQKSLELVHISDETILDELHEKTFQRQGLARGPGHSLLLQSITKRAIENHFGVLNIARTDGQAIAAILYLWDDRTVYYLFAASHPDFRKFGGNTFLLAHMIKDAYARGCKEVDFVGVNSPNRGDYKISFNSELQPYFICSLMI